MRRSSPVKWLYRIVAGIAAKSPAALAINASAMPGATTARLAFPARPMPSKALMIPTTVPNRPMYTVALAVVARNDMPRSSRSPSRAAPQASFCESA